VTAEMLSLVIPVYKNEDNLPRLPRELEQLADRFSHDLEIVFVVDVPQDPVIVRLLTSYSREAAIEDFTLYRRTD
jgi:uncharacterized membrane protein